MTGEPQEARIGAARSLPSGVITFVFTDIEGSTRLLRKLEDRYAELLDAHNQIVRGAIRRHGGIEMRMEGDSFLCVFTDPAAALATCLEVQLELHRQQWPLDVDLRVRIGLHTGEAQPTDSDYIGLAVHQAARVVDSGHGGQVLVSDATRHALGGSTPAGVVLRPLGAYRMKDFPLPTQLYQLCHPALPQEFPALRALPAAAHNVPEQTTLFVDRRTEVVELAELVTRKRVVSILGAGGVGKTRLATETVPLLVPSFADGVWLIELARLATSEAVGLEVATALGVRPEAERDVVETLADAVIGKQLLLLLDNCEHVLDAVAALIQGLVSRCASVHVLTTSREPIGTNDETRFALAPLEVPAASHSGDYDGADAVALFADRAKAAARAFDLDRERDSVLEICRRLDGLPLAIELAAARTASIPVSRIAARLDRRFSVIGQSYRGALPHHETLRGSIEWSHDLLDPTERVLLRRVGIFTGAFDLEAAEEICASAPLTENDVLDVLGRLVDKSLVQRAEDRFLLLESIREFAREKLEEADERERLADAHVAHYARIAENAAHEENGPHQRTAYDRIDSDFPNIRAAAERALDRSDASALRLGAALFHFGFVRNRLAEVARWCIDAVAEAPDAPAPLKARALTAAGSALVVMGSPQRGHLLVDEGLELAHAVGDPDLLAETLLTAADMRLECGFLAEARTLAREALEIIPADGSEWMRARALVIVARAEQDEVSYADTHQRLSHAQALFERAGDRRQVARVLLTLAYVALDADETDAAERAAAECVAICTELAHPIGQAVARVVQVWTAIDRGAPDVARDLLTMTVATARDSGYRALLAYCVAARAGVAANDGDPTEAARMLGLLASARDALGGEGAGATYSRAKRLTAQLESILDVEDFAALRAEGARLTLDEALARPLTS